MRTDGWGVTFTKRARSLLTRTVLLLLLGNTAALIAYDSSPMARNSAQATDDPTVGIAAGAPSVPEASVSTTSTAAKASGRKSSAGSTTTTTTIPMPPPFLPDFTYEVWMQPTCAGIGEDFTITAKVEPWVTVGFVAMYADGYYHDTMYGKTAEEDGLVSYTWKAPPAPGEGTMYTSATAPGATRHGATPVSFRIVSAGESC